MSKNIIKNTLLQCIHFTGINFLTRKIYSNYPRIIMFHKIYNSVSNEFSGMTTDAFRQYLTYIKKNYCPLKIRELIDSRNLQGRYPKNAVAITFDDGFKSFYDFALPLLYEFDIPATIFVVPDLIEKNSWIWPDQISYLYDKGYNNFTDKTKNQLLSELKTMSSFEREKFINAAIRTSGISMPETIPENFQLMSWDILRKISKSNLIEIGSHTLTHPILSTENTDISHNEIYSSRNILEKKLGQPVQSICYPNGQIGDYTIEQIEMIRQAGYRCGISSHFGYVTPKSNVMALPRIGGDHQNIYSFYKYLDGIEYILRKVTNKHCELCLQKDFQYRITKEFCIEKNCSF